MNRPWRGGFHPNSQDFHPRFDSTGPSFQGFEEHSAQWGVNMDHPPPNIFTPDRRPDLPGPRLPMPVETPVPSTQTDLDVLKQEIKGLSATMLALSSSAGW